MPVTFRGPVFDGTAEWMLTMGIEDARKAFADKGLATVFQSGTAHFRNPTGRWQSLLSVDYRIGTSTIRPGFLPYVRWLEGTSRRNATTRFKGYANFRESRIKLEPEYRPFMERQLVPVIARING